MRAGYWAGVEHLWRDALNRVEHSVTHRWFFHQFDAQRWVAEFHRRSEVVVLAWSVAPDTDASPVPTSP